MAVEPKVFDLLAHLIANRDHVVGKDDLILAIWDGRIVSKSALRPASMLRAAPLVTVATRSALSRRCPARASVSSAM